MKFIRSVLFFSLLIALTGSQLPARRSLPDSYPIYNGNDLGVNYSPGKTLFKIWAPGASAVKLRLYAAGEGGTALQTIDLPAAPQGLWSAEVKQDLKNEYYTFQVNRDGRWLAEVPDIYAKAVGVNGRRGMVVDLHDTDPPDWNKDKRPGLKNLTD